MSNKDIFAAKKVDEGKLQQSSLHLDYLFKYGVNFIDRIITLSDEIDVPKFDIIDAAMSEMERLNRKRITIRLNSPGGSTYEALAIIGRLRKSPCNIITEIYGHAMSAATLIAASGDIRKMSEYAYIMHHSCEYGVERGKPLEHRALAEQFIKEEKNWAKWMAKFSKEDENYWYNKGLDVNFYLNPEEALALGVIDEIF